MATTGIVREAVMRVAVEDLGSHLGTLEAELSGGRSIELVRGGRVIAEVRAKAGVVVGEGRAAMPDFMGRMRKHFPDGPVDVDTTALIRADRDARG